ncbi:DNA-3-methyladenine glycosylase 2 family protein [Shewanella algae]|uniref:DNA-3-methyladenine glycosylase 2 family protein n=2 Tax=Shewanella algae TaxID=38313 RepID=UPI001182CD52|nr:AlkA N-terminal domain-containing protein [Shewanella algae]
MMTIFTELSADTCRRARLSRDPRFDGRFFIGVKTTGIYCRPICPAVAPKEENVDYFFSAAAAANQGLRPCLRCRPESAPGSCAWKGTRTTLERAVTLIEQGALSGESAKGVEHLAQRLGISSRYLRKLFVQALGLSPKQYAAFQQLMFAKQLLHQTRLPITQVALAAGYTSIRRFNEVFQSQLQLTPSALRRSADTQMDDSNRLQLFLSYRPPYAWQALLDFYRLRAVTGMEWFELDGRQGYGRSLLLNSDKGGFKAWFFAELQASQNRVAVTLALEEGAEFSLLPVLVNRIRRILDLDADMQQVEQVLQPLTLADSTFGWEPGLRLPAVGSLFEAGVRAVLGQQVSVTQATKLLGQLVAVRGERRVIAGREISFFPEPESMLAADFDELKMPGSRKTALAELARFQLEHGDTEPEAWLSLKGIGPWTIAYARMRGLSDPDVLLGGDLIIRKRLLTLFGKTAISTGVNGNLAQLNPDSAKQGAVGQHKGKKSADKKSMDNKSDAKKSAAHYQALLQGVTEAASPWGSYLTLQLWQSA